MEVFAYVIMSNHIHLIARAKEGFNLSYIIRDFKKFTSTAITAKIIEIGESRRDWLLDKIAFETQRIGRAKYYKLWRDDNHAICLQKTEWIIQRLNYIHQNPVRQMIVSNSEDYIFSIAIDYADSKGLLNIIKII